MNGDRVFHIGDRVVYPNHGVGIIEQISSRTIGLSIEKFYLLKIKASSLKVMVPFHNVTSVGLRPVVRNGEVQKIVDYLSSVERARYLLVSELAISRNCDEVEVEQVLAKALTKCNLRFPELAELAS